MNSKKVNAYKVEMENAVSAYVTGYNSHALTKAKLKGLKQGAKAAIDGYNDVLAKETYKNWNAEGDPIKTAIRMRYVPNCLRVSFKVDDSDTMAASYHPLQYKANLPMMHAVLGAQVFHDAAWFTKLEKLAHIIANRVNRELGAKAGFNYEVSEAAKAFQFPNGSDPANIVNMASALQDVFDSILYIPAEDGSNLIRARIVEDIDGNKQCPAWAYIRDLMTAEGEADGQVYVHNTGKMSDLIAGAMHTIITSGDFCAIAGDRYDIPKEEQEEEAPAADEQGEEESAEEQE